MRRSRGLASALTFALLVGAALAAPAVVPARAGNRGFMTMWWFWKRKKDSEPVPAAPAPADPVDSAPSPEPAPTRTRPGIAGPQSNLYHTPNQRPVPRRRPSKRR